MMAASSRPLASERRDSHEILQFNRSSDCWLDVATFVACPMSDEESPHEVGQLGEAVVLWRGEFLEGLFVDDGPASKSG